mgnify:CR=1 FL=1
MPWTDLLHRRERLPAAADLAEGFATLLQTLGNNLKAFISQRLVRTVDGQRRAAVEVLLGTANTLGKRLVALAGDTHNAWHSDLTLMGGTKVGEEFATPGVSSPGLEEYLSAIPPANAASIFTGVIDTLNYADTARRGFLLMTFTPTTATAGRHSRAGSPSMKSASGGLEIVRSGAG